MSKIEKAIAYFEDAVKESDEIIADCTEALQTELTEQKQHFVVALEVMRRAEPENKPLTDREKYLRMILAERDRQDAKWGYPLENTFCEWSSILAEEAGELAKELNELNFGRGNRENMIAEATQVAAVALSILEQQDIADMVTAAWFAYRNARNPEQEEK